ncbi:MAG: sodium/proton-translocating pyrophosphatase, partial [Deltaproteobacteria bacterium]|nr:sodium/proton-translocating pyrophosphatase [Deltaproteobacteria bacterium]
MTFLGGCEVVAVIYGCGVLAILAAVFYAWRVVRVPIEAGTTAQVDRLKEISDAIAEGAMAFLSREYLFVGAFALAFAGLIYFALNTGTLPFNEGAYSAVSFLAGAVTSSICAFLGMKIATMGNVRATSRAQQSIGSAFRVAFDAGAVMGFGLVGLALLALITITLVYTQLLGKPELVMDMVAGFGLGGSTVALFGRVGGGIYTKAADVGADLVGKVEQGIPEDDPRNPAVIADNVGDNVGDIAGMGADLFGSLAEATCAALVIGATAEAIATNVDALLYPIAISAVGIPVCLLTALFARLGKDSTAVEPVLKRQLLISTVLMSIAIYLVTDKVMVESFTVGTTVVTKTGVLASILA